MQRQGYNKAWNNRRDKWWGTFLFLFLGCAPSLESVTHFTFEKFLVCYEWSGRENSRLDPLASSLSFLESTNFSGDCFFLFSAIKRGNDGKVERETEDGPVSVDTVVVVVLAPLSVVRCRGTNPVRVLRQNLGQRFRKHLILLILSLFFSLHYFLTHSPHSNPLYVYIIGRYCSTS